MGRTDVGQVLVILLRHVGAEEEAFVLREGGHGLSHADIVALLHQQTLDVAADGGGDHLSAGCLVLGHGLVADAGVLVGFLGTGKVLLRDDAVGQQGLHAFIFLLGGLVGHAGFLHRVAFGHLVGREGQQGFTFAHAHSFDDASPEVDHAADRSHGHTLVALRGQYLSAGLDDAMEGAGLYFTDGHAGRLGLVGREDDFVASAVSMGFFGLVVVSCVFVGRVGVACAEQQEAQRAE